MSIRVILRRRTRRPALPTRARPLRSQRRRHLSSRLSHGRDQSALIVSRLIIDARWLYTGLGAYTLQLIRGLHELGTLPVTLITLPEHRAKLAPFGYEVVLSKRPALFAARANRCCQAGARLRSTARAALQRSAASPQNAAGEHPRPESSARPNHAPQPEESDLCQAHVAARGASGPITSSPSRNTPSERSSSTSEPKPEKITVTYTGVPPHIYPEPRDESRTRTNHTFGFSGNYLLFVGNLKPHKNVRGLLRACALLHQRGKLDHTSADHRRRSTLATGAGAGVGRSRARRKCRVCRPGHRRSGSRRLLWRRSDRCAFVPGRLRVAGD